MGEKIGVPGPRTLHEGGARSTAINVQYSRLVLISLTAAVAPTLVVVPPETRTMIGEVSHPSSRKSMELSLASIHRRLAFVD